MKGILRQRRAGFLTQIRNDMIILEIIGTVSVVSFLCSAVITIILQRCIDPVRVKEHPNVSSVFVLGGFVPREILNQRGRKLWIVRNVLLGIGCLGITILIVALNL